MQTPDFFIIGAPKCGTTALSEYLRRHPQICFSATKEPHFYADDFPVQRLDSSKAAYWRRNFSDFDPSKHKIVGEGSVFYYLSDIAVPKILDENPRAKFIYMIRDPVELAHSFYCQMRVGGGEDVETFEEAWNIQDERLAGRRIPLRSNEPKLLQYRRIAAVGVRLKVLEQIIPSAQLMVIRLEDLAKSPQATYDMVLCFLGVEHDGRSDFPIINEHKVERSRAVGILAHGLPKWLHASVREAKRVVGLQHVPLNVFAALNAKKAPRQKISDETRLKVTQELEAWVRELPSENSYPGIAGS